MRLLNAARRWRGLAQLLEIQLVSRRLAASALACGLFASCHFLL